MIGSVASLMAITGFLAALPMAPAFLELYLRRDTAPIPVKNRSEVIADLAHEFRSDLADDSAAVPAGTLVRDTDWFVDEGVSIADPIYAKGRLAAGGNNVFAAIFCEKDVDLGKNSKVLSWVHAEGVVIVPSGSTVCGRLSAGERVELGTGCGFERVHAPVIIVAGGAEAMYAEQPEVPDKDHFASAPRVGSLSGSEAPEFNPEPLSILERVTERVFVTGDFILQPGAVLPKNVVAVNQVHLMAGSQVAGCVKSNREMELGPNVVAEGSLVSASDMRIGAGCHVMGPVLAEGELVIESGARIGTPTHPTSVRAPRIRIAAGVSIHGSLWASELGQVT
jgi:predicted acyltransferase (DUF342 family)